jgi:hypothetical protein
VETHRVAARATASIVFIIIPIAASSLVCRRY